LLEWNLGKTAYSQLGCIPELPLEALAVTKFSLLSRRWQLKLVGSVAIVGTLLTAVGESVNAQIVPDNTLGAESSVVTPIPNIQGIPSDQIDGGATRGANLFHSFSQFNIGAGRGAYFTNPAGILNILTRVTGANRSEILGRLGVNGPANLFLINPNGIVFGPNASLDVQGSFLATTADAVKLGDTGLFSASQPTTSNLLTVRPSALWFNAVAAQPVVNQSQAPSLIGEPNSDGSPPGLQVPVGETLALVGGDVLLEGGNLTAAAGRIELGSVAGAGEVSLSQTGNRIVLGYDSIDMFATISLSNGAFVDASGEGGGDIQIRGTRLEMTQGSNIWANTLGAENGGEVLVRTTEVVLSEGSFLTAEVFGTGTGGNLTIDTRRLLVRDGAVVSASNVGEGNAGNLSVTASERIEVSGSNPQGFPSGIKAPVEEGATGDGGNLTLETGQLSVSQGGQIDVSTFGPGNAGQLKVNATEIELIGINPIDGSPSGLFATVKLNDATGKGGDVNIQTQSLRIIDGANLSASTSGQGDAGNLSVTASERIEMSGFDRQGNSSRIEARVEEGATGDGGNLTLETGQLSVSQGGQISVGTFGTGDAGELKVNATEIELIGINPIEGSPSGLFATVERNDATGKGGDVTIQTQSLRIIDGAILDASTSGQGDAGNVSVTATERIEMSGFDLQGFPSSNIVARVNSGATGDGGNLTLETGQLSVSQGGQISVGTFGTGNAGELNVNATEIELIGINPIDGSPSGLFAIVEPNATGKGGDVTIQTQSLRIIDGAILAASTLGQGDAGNLSVTASERIEVSGSDPQGFPSVIAAEVISGATGDGGNLTVETGQLSLSQGGLISVRTFGGNAGKLNVNATEIELIGTDPIDGTPSGLFATVSSNATGNGGDVTIDTHRLLLRDGAEISSASRGDGTAGNINITVRDTLEANNGTIETNTNRSAGGAITINARDIRLFGDSDIRSNVASGADNGGNINLTADSSILAFDDSDILAFASDGRGGDITLNTPAFFGENYRPAPKGTDPNSLENNNQVDVNATGAVNGVITTPDTTFIQNSLTELPENQIDTDSLLANSCIVRRNQPTRGSFTIIGTGGFPQRPGDAQISTFPTVNIETLPNDSTPTNTNPNRPWQKGDPIVEPQGVYRLPNGKLVLSRECP
jgi:filamentous hemagglutinin family protein